MPGAGWRRWAWRWCWIPSDLHECVEVTRLLDKPLRVVINTNRTAIAQDEAEHPEQAAALLLAMFVSSTGECVCAMHGVRRNRDHADAAAAAVTWWQRNSADPESRYKPITCDLCRRQDPPKPSVCSCCYQCQAFLCDACARRRGASGGGFKCHRCGYSDYASGVWGVPWDMPRPAPTHRPSAAAAPPPPPQRSTALPPRMAQAVGPDGWLRLPPQHQQMHPVDVLVDGVLNVLDGEMMVCPYLPGSGGSEADEVTFMRWALAEQFSGGVTLDVVRRRLKQRVDRLLQQASSTPIQVIRVAVSVVCSHVVWTRRRWARLNGPQGRPSNAGALVLPWCCSSGAAQGVTGAPHG